MNAAARQFWDAWSDCSTTRFWSDYGAPQPIQRSEIREWLDDEGIDDRAERSELMWWVLWIDGVYIRIKGEQAAAKQKSQPKKERQPRGRR